MHADALIRREKVIVSVFGFEQRAECRSRLLNQEQVSLEDQLCISVAEPENHELSSAPPSQLR